MILVVSGSRNWTDVKTVYSELDGIHRRYKVEAVFHGEAAGLDRLAKRWAEDRGIPAFGCPYPGTYGSAGGPIRNGWLLEFSHADLLVAFPLPDSRGTWNMVTQAKAKRVPIRIVRTHL